MSILRNTGSSLLLLVSFLSLPVWAGSVDTEGYVNAQAEYDEQTGKGEVTFGADLKFESKRREGFKAHVDIEGRSDKREMRLEQAYVDYKTQDIKYYLGLKKKRLGLEYVTSRWDRVWPEHSLVYDKLEQFTFVGYENQLGISMEWGEGWQADLALGLPESKDLNIVGRIEYEQDDRFGNFSWGAVAQRDRWDQERREIVYASVLGIYSTLNSSNYAFELMFGINPIASEFASLQKGQIHHVPFQGGRLLLRQKLPFESMEDWELMAQFAAYHEDRWSSEQSEYQAGLGIWWDQGQLRWKTIVQLNQRNFEFGRDLLESGRYWEFITDVQVPL